MSGERTSRAKDICEKCNKPYELHMKTNEYCPRLEMVGYGPTQFKASRLMAESVEPKEAAPEADEKDAIVTAFRAGFNQCRYMAMNIVDEHDGFLNRIES